MTTTPNQAHAAYPVMGNRERQHKMALRQAADSTNVSDLGWWLEWAYARECTAVLLAWCRQQMPVTS